MDLNDFSSGEIGNDQMLSGINRMKSVKACLIVILLTIIFGCKSAEISSYWRSGEVAIDGSNKEWEGKTWIIKGMEKIAIGFMNDDKYLYLSVTVSDKELQRQISFGGLRLWFDQAGGEEKLLGIQYPIDLPMEEAGSARKMMKREQVFQKDSPAIFPEKFSDEIDIYGPGEEQHTRIRKGEAGGIDVTLRFSGSLLIYEMKVPLNDSRQEKFSIGAQPGSAVGVGIETAAGIVPGSQDEGPIDIGGAGEHIGMRGERGERIPRQMMDSKNVPVELWAKVQLALSDSGF